MQTRRAFINFVSRAACGAFFAQSLAPERREVTLGKKRIKVVDIHGHFVEPTELDVIKDTKLAPNITDNMKGQLVLSPQRLQVLDRLGIDIQVLSHQGAW